jgi:hypothetical protein
MDDDDELELEPEDDDDIDGLFDWAVDTLTSGGTDLKDYTATVDNGTLTSVSDGTTTITF